MDGVAFGESPRWHDGRLYDGRLYDGPLWYDGRLWYADWGAGRVLTVTADGSCAVEAVVASFPMCIDVLPDGRLLVVSSAARQLLRREPDGALVEHAALPRS